MFAFPENWDADAEIDGVTLSIVFLDQNDESVLAGRKINFPIDIEVWTLTGPSISNKGQKIYSKSTILEIVDTYGSVGRTRVFGNTKSRIAYDELKGYKTSTVGILVKVHLPDGRTIEASDWRIIP